MQKKQAYNKANCKDISIIMYKSKKREKSDNETTQLLYSTDWEKSALVNNFQKRGWREVPSFDGEWNFYWACPQNCRYIFRVDYPYRMRKDQMINHFPNSMELSRKDLLVKNIKRYRKDLERKGDPLAEMHSIDMKLGIGGTRYVHLDIIPMTFVLPTDYHLFVEEFQKNPASTWIVKPCGKSQGEGIYLINNLTRLRKFAYDSRTFYVPHFNRETCVISKYIENPLLIGGKKFDLRLYVLVTSFNPLKAYLYNEGFCRFCIEKYKQSEIDNVFMHLTNVSIQKTSQEYNAIHGGKWPIQNLWLYLDSTFKRQVSDTLMTSIKRMMRHSLDAVAPIISNDKHCFEVYGYDIIIDNNLKPWLIEINTSPSMHATTVNDRTMKSRLIENVLAVILPPSGIPDISWDKTPTEAALKNFTVLTPVAQQSSTDAFAAKVGAKLRKRKKRAVAKKRKSSAAGSSGKSKSTAAAAASAATAPAAASASNKKVVKGKAVISQLSMQLTHKQPPTEPQTLSGVRCKNCKRLC